MLLAPIWMPSTRSKKPAAMNDSVHKAGRLDMEKVVTMQQLYIAQLRSSIGDLLASGRARGWFWRTIWNNRVEAAQALLRRREL